MGKSTETKVRYILEPSPVINTFIITTYHDKYIERCLKTLETTIDRDKHRIIFIEAPSLSLAESGLAKLVEPYVDIYVKTKRNYGFSASVNIGIMMSRTPYFTVVHDDVWFIHKGWWEETAVCLDDITLMVQPNQRFRREEKPIPEFPTEEEYQEMLKTAINGSVVELYCMIFKREFVDKVGYMNESIYPIGPEDIEIFYRTGKMGYRTAMVNRAIVYHSGAGRETSKKPVRLDFPLNTFIDKEKLREDKLGPPLLKQL